MNNTTAMEHKKMNNKQGRLQDIVESHGYNGRIKIHTILQFYIAPDGEKWRQGIPNLWEMHEAEIIREIQRIITRGRGKTTVTLTSRETLRLDEAIRLVAYLSLGYSAVPYQFLDLSKKE